MKNCVILLCLLTLCYSCTPKGNCEHKFTFDFPMSVTPQDTFRVGDTIWYEMHLPNQLIDHTSGAYVDFTDVELFFSISITKWAYQLKEGIIDFEIVQDIGVVRQETDLFIDTYLYFDDVVTKDLRFGLVAKDTGLYSNELSLPYYFIDKEYRKYNDPERFKLTDTHCWQYITPKSDVVVNEGNINYYLIDNVCLPSSISGDTFCAPSYDLAVRGGYHFVVKG